MLLLAEESVVTGEDTGSVRPYRQMGAPLGKGAWGPTTTLLPPFPVFAPFSSSDCIFECCGRP